MYQGNHFYGIRSPLICKLHGAVITHMPYQFDNPKCETYSVFDSHSRNVTGNPTPEGAAVLLTLDSIEDLSQYLLRLYPNILFN